MAKACFCNEKFTQPNPQKKWLSHSTPSFVIMVYARAVKLIHCCGSHLYTWILYGPDSVEKNISRQGYISAVPKLFCLPAQGASRSNFAAHQPRKSIPTDGGWHYLEITTSPGNDFRKSCDVARNGADLRKKGHYFMVAFSQFWQQICINIKHFKKTGDTSANLPQSTV